MTRVGMPLLARTGRLRDSKRFTNGPSSAGGEETQSLANSSFACKLGKPFMAGQ